ncbi:hypothetical protein [Pedobacter heparinus]|uniref:hypothetical protein n=1 Tax=Pedobacter heparinus TaxID=984 RepID=UPI00292FEC6A|nr:hypothetical protein [Pedobacter heparinus]
MKLNILCDADWEAKIDAVLFALNNLGYRRFFNEKNYGCSVEGIIIVLMCQEPALNLKQRIRHSKKEKSIYLDIMLDLLLFKQIDQEERNRIVAGKIIKEVPSIIEKYKLQDFDVIEFTTDLKKMFGKL